MNTNSSSNKLKQLKVFFFKNLYLLSRFKIKLFLIRMKHKDTQHDKKNR